MYSNTVITLCQTIKPVKLSVTRTQSELTLKKQLLEETKFLPDETKISTRYYCVLNNITEIPKCICGNDCIPNKKDAKLGFTEYCSTQCSRENSHIDPEIKKKLLDKDWLYNQRITQRKSKNTIATELGCSHIAIDRQLKIHNIPDIKYNEMDADTKKYLLDKDWLYQQHKVLRKDFRTIAKEINSSPFIIGTYLEKYSIEANKTNSYPRKHVVISTQHQNLIDFIKSFYSGSIITNDRTILNGYELDIYLPDAQLAIEYGSIYSHLYRPEETSFAAKKSQYYHVKKTNECEASGIHLLQIFGSNWKEEIWKSIIKNKLGFTETKIFARNCIIQDVSITDKNLFLEENHLQGKDASTYKYGLYHNQELVALMTFGKSRFNKHFDWELIRFCIKKNTNIIGGFSKLLKHFRNQHQGSIISYADRTYSNGKVYETNGFQLWKTNPPGYWYVKKNSEIMQHRSNFMKAKITTSEDTRTEEQIMFANGYSKIFDCGTKTYVLT